ncbi:hypothetical protein ANCDUO_00574 [Ancylostoma duodenale]|uniref:Uncharacterized protein n=1 Tax=Ancylostoma duodenale TaxID=51022 RepID=A0A0C2HBP9_9BILA|nr:hypothetical protein ANCDUO_00574 [Ancylostoma duodenale]
MPFQRHATKSTASKTKPSLVVDSACSPSAGPPDSQVLLGKPVLEEKAPEAVSLFNQLITALRPNPKDIVEGEKTLQIDSNFWNTRSWEEAHFLPASQLKKLVCPAKGFERVHIRRSMNQSKRQLDRELGSQARELNDKKHASEKVSTTQ